MTGRVIMHHDQGRLLFTVAREALPFVYSSYLRAQGHQLWSFVKHLQLSSLEALATTMRNSISHEPSVIVFASPCTALPVGSGDIFRHRPSPALGSWWLVQRQVILIGIYRICYIIAITPPGTRLASREVNDNPF